MAEITLDRKDVLPVLFPNPENYLIVTGLAGAAKDAAEYTREADNLITMGGAMGRRSPSGRHGAVGLFRAGGGDYRRRRNPDDGRVPCLGRIDDADNLTIVCIDNGMHGETGGQKGHTARRTDLAKMAEGAGIPSTMTISTPAELDAGYRFLQESPAPRFLCVKVTDAPPSSYKRNWDLVEGRLKFRNAYLARQKSA